VASQHLQALDVVLEPKAVFFAGLPPNHHGNIGPAEVGTTGLLTFRGSSLIEARRLYGSTASAASARASRPKTILPACLDARDLGSDETSMNHYNIVIGIA